MNPLFSDEKALVEYHNELAKSIKHLKIVSSVRSNMILMYLAFFLRKQAIVGFIKLF